MSSVDTLLYATNVSEVSEVSEVNLNCMSTEEQSPWDIYISAALSFLCLSSLQPHRVHVDKPCRIHERSGVTPQVPVISLSIKKTLHLLHVCHPINFCVFLEMHKSVEGGTQDRG